MDNFLSMLDIVWQGVVESHVSQVAGIDSVTDGSHHIPQVCPADIITVRYVNEVVVAYNVVNISPGLVGGS